MSKLFFIFSLRTIKDISTISYFENITASPELQIPSGTMLSFTILRVITVFICLIPSHSFLVSGKAFHRCPLLKYKIVTVRNCRVLKCTFQNVMKKSGDFRKKGVEVMIQEGTFLKFFMNQDEVFIMNELISILVHQSEWKMKRKNRIYLFSRFTQIVLKRFLIPLLLKHSFFMLNEFFRSLLEL